MTDTVENITVFSPNLLKLFDDCPAKFYYKYIEQIPEITTDKGFLIGKNIHAIASYYLKGIKIEKFENSLTRKEAEIWDYLKENPYFQYETLGVEQSISVRLGDFWIGGRLDAIVKNGSDYYILDYKTGGIKDEMTYDMQTMVYLLVCDEKFKQKSSLSFIYLDLKNKREVKTVLTDELRAEYTEKLTNTYNKIKNFNIKRFSPPNQCSCAYSKVCKPY